MADTGTLHDAFIEELRDTYDAERQLAKALPKMVKAASAPDLKAAFQTHLDETLVPRAMDDGCAVGIEQVRPRTGSPDDYPYYLMRGRVSGEETESLQGVKPGEGAVVERDGRKIAACRDESGALTLRSAICPHLGCVVAWNTAERTWDCPCHGSRFTAQGEVISGPAESPLAEVQP